MINENIQIKNEAKLLRQLLGAAFIKGLNYYLREIKSDQ